MAGRQGAGDGGRRPTIKDVAAAADVSIATVSRVLNGFTNVDPVLGAKVSAAVRALGYRRDGLARGLRRQATTVLGMIVPDIENPFFTSVVRGAEDAAQRAGFLLMICNSDENVAKEAAYLDVLLGQSIAGLILVAADERHSDVGPFTEWGTPLVAVDRRVGNGQVDAVLVDNAAGARRATEHLITAGYRRIATIAGPVRTTTGLERHEGYRMALATAGLPYDPDLVAHADFHVDGGYAAASVLLDLPDPPDAVFVANNQMGVGSIQAIADRGLQVPDDLAMTVFDELPSGVRWRESITFVAQPAYEIGRAAAEVLLRRIHGDGSSQVTETRLAPTLHDPTLSRQPAPPGGLARRHAARGRRLAPDTGTRT